MVFPIWNPIEIWHWGDSTSFSLGVIGLTAPVFFLVGGGLMVFGVVIALGPFQPPRLS